MLIQHFSVVEITTELTLRQVLAEFDKLNLSVAQDKPAMLVGNIITRDKGIYTRNCISGFNHRVCLDDLIEAGMCVAAVPKK